MATFILCLIHILPGYSQIQPDTLEVRVYKLETKISDFEIANITLTKEGIYTDGKKYILAKPGDYILIAPRLFDNMTVEITPESSNNKILIIQLEPDIIDLEEVVVSTPVEISGLPKVKVAPPAQRRFNAGTYGNMSFQKSMRNFMNNGPSLSLDPLLNMISGRSRQLKSELKSDQKQRTVQFLESYYMPYIQEMLGVPEAQMGLYLYFVADKNRHLYNNKDTAQVKKLLRMYYLQYLDHIQETPSNTKE